MTKDEQKQLAKKYGVDLAEALSDMPPGLFKCGTTDDIIDDVQDGLKHGNTKSDDGPMEWWQKESRAANDCIVEILESYFEFIEIMERTLAKCTVPEKIKPMADALIKKRRADWQPILDKCKSMQGK